MSRMSIDKELTRLLDNKRKLEELNVPDILLEKYNKEIDFLTEQFKSGKRWMHQIKELKPEYRWEYITPLNKKEYWENNGSSSIKFTDNIQCIHCGETYPVAQYIVQRDNFSGMEYICCKNHKKCNGTLIDFMPVNKNNTEK